MRTLLSCLLPLIALPLLVSAETWKGTILDVHCKGMDPASHTRECALHNAKQGLGLTTADGRFLKFDKRGNAKALAAINATKEEKLTAEVAGTLKGDTIRVDSIQMVSGEAAGQTATGGAAHQMPGHEGMGMGMSHGAMMGMGGGDKPMACPMMKMHMQTPAAGKTADGNAKAMDMPAHGCCPGMNGAADHKH